MNVIAIQTPIFKIGECLNSFLETELQQFVLEGKVIAITSKILSLSEKCLVPFHSTTKKELVQKESDHYLGEIGYDVHLTVKHGLLIPSAGIDESNSPDQDFILYPEDPFGSLEKVYVFLKNRFSLQHFGLILTDSHTTPLRKGVTGISLAHWGFQAVENKVGHEDLFQKKLQYTSVNYADALASAATLLMGEANECCPLALIDCDKVIFSMATNPQEVQIPLEEDLYYPILKDKIKK